jgi:hypothetical protein
MKPSFVKPILTFGCKLACIALLASATILLLPRMASEPMEDWTLGTHATLLETAYCSRRRRTA